MCVWRLYLPLGPMEIRIYLILGFVPGKKGDVGGVDLPAGRIPPRSLGGLTPRTDMCIPPRREYPLKIRIVKSPKRGFFVFDRKANQLAYE